MHYVVLTYMGKFHVRNVNESRDVAPCGGVCSKSFIKNLFSPYFSLRFKTLVYWKSSWTATKKYILRLEAQQYSHPLNR